MTAPLKLARTVSFLGADVSVETELPPGSGPRDVVLAVRALDAAARTLWDACRGCGAPTVVHFLDCPLAPDDLVESLRAEAVADGMSPRPLAIPPAVV